MKHPPDEDQVFSRSQTYWLVFAGVIMSVTSAFAMAQAYYINIQNLLEARSQKYNALEARFESDIDQHDKRINNNADNIRTVLRFVGRENIDLDKGIDNDL